MNKIWIIKVIAVCALVTLFERAVPFLIFRGKKVPEPVQYLGKVLPMAIMATLIVYCLKNTDFSSAVLWAPQVVLHLWKRSTMLSIAGGTLCCMVLMQFVFV